MSLDYSFKDCPHFATFNTKEDWPITSTIVQLTMVVGIGHLKTDQDCIDFAVRTHAYETAFGPFLYELATNTAPGGKSLITLAEIRKRIGLRTNVFPKLTDKQFIARIGERLMSDASQSIKHQQQQATRQHAIDTATSVTD